MSGTLALSSFIASLDRDALIALIRARRVLSPSGVNDAIDLATELLRSDSIAQALTQLSSTDLATLAALSRPAAPNSTPFDPSFEQSIHVLLARGLVAEGPTMLPEVAQSLDSLLITHGLSEEELVARASTEIHPRDSISTSEAPDTSAWYASALTSTSQAAWLLRDMTRTPAKLNRNGSVASSWVKSAEERLNIPRADELVDLLRPAGLAHAHDGALTATHHPWLAGNHDERWITLARTAVSQMPEQVFTLLAGAQQGTSVSAIVTSLNQHFPLTTARTTAEITAAASRWERLGITVGGSLSEAGASILQFHTGSVPAVPSFELPQHAPGVYIQPDLSVIVPGPLAVQDEASLATFTQPEQLGVASTLRITEASLADALDRGSNAPAIREFLERITLTGVPQPLDYLITMLQQRAGSVIVAPHSGDEGRTRIDFLRAEIRTTTLVDRTLVHLQLHDGGATATSSGVEHEVSVAPLFSRLRPDHVLAALLDARYPAVAQSDGTTRPGLAVAVAADTPAAPTTDSDTDPAAGPVITPAAAIADRILAALSDGPGEINRQVTLALRDRTTVKISLEMRGKAYEFTVLPVAVSAGRMRALDQVAEVERTIPIDSITAITQLA